MADSPAVLGASRQGAVGNLHSFANANDSHFEVQYPAQPPFLSYPYFVAITGTP